MSKRISFLILSISLILPSITLAQFTQPIMGVTLASLISTILTVFWIIATVFAVVCFVLSGIMFLTAMGDPAKIKIARNSVIFGAIGIVVAILAFSVVNIIDSIL